MPIRRTMQQLILLAPSFPMGERICLRSGNWKTKGIGEEQVMQISTLTEAERDAFLAETRVATLSYLTRSGAPFSVPVWFEWDGTCAHIFADDYSMKVRSLSRDPRACLLVPRPAGEREEWVAIDGTITIKERGGFELAERLARRYWDLTDDYYSAALDEWRQAAESFVKLELVPSKIRSYATR